MRAATLGNISALSGIRDDSRYLQISAPVQAGNSGGPLLDTSGNLVGVVSSKLNAMKVMQASDDLPQNVNFAIKSGTLANFLDANRVTYKVGAPAAVPMQPADIADRGAGRERLCGVQVAGGACRKWAAVVVRDALRSNPLHEATGAAPRAPTPSW